MNICRVLILWLVLMAIGAIPVFSQKKGDLTPLPDNATLQETQKWLIRSLSKYSFYTFKDQEHRIVGLKFDGCQFTYAAEIKMKSDPVFDSRIEERTKPVSPPGTPRTFERGYQAHELDLKDIDPASISFTPYSPGGAPMLQMSFKTLNDKKSLKFYGRHDTSKLSDGYAAGASFIIKESASQYIKDGFLRALKLCQQ